MIPIISLIKGNLIQNIIFYIIALYYTSAFTLRDTEFQLVNIC